MEINCSYCGNKIDDIDMENCCKQCGAPILASTRLQAHYWKKEDSKKIYGKDEYPKYCKDCGSPLEKDNLTFSEFDEYTGKPSKIELSLQCSHNNGWQHEYIILIHNFDVDEYRVLPKVILPKSKEKDIEPYIEEIPEKAEFNWGMIAGLVCAFLLVLLIIFG